MVTRELLDALAEAQRIGAIGPSDLSTHVDHALAFACLLEQRTLPGMAILDLGSGGGLPGLVIAEQLSDRRVTLLDGRTERAARLQLVVERLALSDRVSVEARRAEIAAHDPRLRGAFAAVVARGFAAPSVTAECAAPFLTESGILVVSEPPHAGTTASRWPEAGCAIVHLALVETIDDPYHFAILRSTGPCPTAYPRRIGIPAKRPLF